MMMLNIFKKKSDNKKNKRKIKELQQSVDYIYGCYQDIGKKYFDLSEKIDNIKEYIEKENIDDKERVKNFETMYRNCNDEFYKKSYRRTISAANAVISERLAILKML